MFAKKTSLFGASADLDDGENCGKRAAAPMRCSPKGDRSRKGFGDDGLCDTSPNS